MQVRQRTDKEDSSGYLETHTCIQYADLYNVSVKLQCSLVLLAHPKNGQVLYDNQRTIIKFLNEFISLILMKWWIINIKHLLQAVYILIICSSWIFCWWKKKRIFFLVASIIYLTSNLMKTWWEVNYLINIQINPHSSIHQNYQLFKTVQLWISTISSKSSCRTFLLL